MRQAPAGLGLGLRRNEQRVGSDKDLIWHVGPFAPQHIEVALVPAPQELQTLVILQSVLNCSDGRVTVLSSSLRECIQNGFDA